MRLFDCVIVDKRSDLDLLETRMMEMQDIPGVVHVVCEAPVDFRGNPKREYFLEERYSDRFFRWHGRWNHVQVAPSELPEGQPPKIRKDALREYLFDGVPGVPGDLVMHGSVDEIPAERAVRHVLSGGCEFPVVLEMRWCARTVTQVHARGVWRGTAVDRWSQVGSFTGLRERRGMFPALLEAGTRLAMMGVPGEVYPDGFALWGCEVDGSFPRAVREGVCPRGWFG